MIKANELRIGNIVFEENGHIAKIRLIRKTTGNKFTPVPLTPEILEKAGFEEHNQTSAIELGTIDKYLWFVVNSENKYYPQVEQMGEFSHQDSQIVSLPFIKSLHQLQNLYFALTGEELEINL